MADGDCVGEEELRGLLRGELPDAVAGGITRHIEACPRCEEAARRLDAETEPFVSCLRLALRRRERPADPSTGTMRQDTPKEEQRTVATGEGRRPAVAGYEVLGELGRGGMSVVYKARQAHPARLVALKVLLAGGHAGPQQQARFLAEGDALARLQHPNIVQVFEVGQCDGVPWLALEYMAGGSLMHRLAGIPQPAREAAALVQVLARAVQHAHAQGVIHRDLKPANVLLTEEGTPKIADFGLAKQERPELTPTGAILGTPSYMAPEQAEAKKDVGPAVDVYALGAILYELLTGRPPFRGATVLETLEQVRTQEPVPPSQLQPGTPRDLGTICLKCLQKEPAKRYAGAQELADDLRRFLDGRPILARPVGPLGRAGRWARRNPGWAAMFGSVAALLLTTATVAVSL
jgi:serine/threonine protein kinase